MPRMSYTLIRTKEDSDDKDRTGCHVQRIIFLDEPNKWSTPTQVEMGNEHFEEPKKWKRTVSQIVAVGAKNMLVFSFGTAIGFTTVLIPALLPTDGTTDGLGSGDDHILLSTEQISWFASLERMLLCLFTTISGYLSDKFGRHRIMMSVCIIKILPWITYYYSNSAEMLYVSIIIQAACYGISEAAILSFIGEICEPRIRGTLAVTSPLFLQSGVFSQFLLRNIMEWRTMALTNIAFPVATLVALYLVPESPVWLLSRGRSAEAESALCRLRGWASPKYVQKELEDFKMFQASPQSKNSSFYKQQSCWAPSFVMAITAILILIFQSLGSPLNSHHSATVFTAAQIIGCIVCVFSVPYIGKRRITIFTTFISAILLAIVAVYAKYRQQLTDYKWIPLIGLMGSNFFMNWGISALVFVLITEMFPMAFRGLGSSGILIILNLLWFGSFKTFFVCVEHLGMWVLLSYYSTISFLLSLFLLAYLPETEGRTLLEIQQQYTGSKAWDRRSDMTNFDKNLFLQD